MRVVLLAPAACVCWAVAVVTRIAVIPVFLVAIALVSIGDLSAVALGWCEGGPPAIPARASGLWNILRRVVR